MADSAFKVGDMKVAGEADAYKSVLIEAGCLLGLCPVRGLF